MRDSRKAKATKIQDSIRRILYHDWNPIGVSDLPQDEYDSYIAPVYRILAGNRSEQELVECLSRTESDVVGERSGSPAKWRPVAIKLLEIDTRL
jgi:hypothetical protein